MATLSSSYDYEDPSSLALPPSPMVGYVFGPTPIEILFYFLPMKLANLDPLPPPFNHNVLEIDLYGESLPEFMLQSLENYDNVESYFFTKLIPKTDNSMTRISRISGEGFWKCQRSYTYRMMIEGKKMDIGTKRLFNYHYANKEVEHKLKDVMGISWTMHEFSLEKDFLEYLIRMDYIIDSNGTNLNELKNIVFCHVHKKIDKECKEQVEEDNKKFKKARYSNEIQGVESAGQFEDNEIISCYNDGQEQVYFDDNYGDINNIINMISFDFDDALQQANYTLGINDFEDQVNNQEQLRETQSRSIG